MAGIVNVSPDLGIPKLYEIGHSEAIGCSTGQRYVGFNDEGRTVEQKMGFLSMLFFGHCLTPAFACCVGCSKLPDCCCSTCSKPDDKNKCWSCLDTCCTKLVNGKEKLLPPKLTNEVYSKALPEKIEGTEKLKTESCCANQVSMYVGYDESGKRAYLKQEHTCAAIYRLCCCIICCEAMAASCSECCSADTKACACCKGCCDGCQDGLDRLALPDKTAILNQLKQNYGDDIIAEAEQEYDQEKNKTDDVIGISKANKIVEKAEARKNKQEDVTPPEDLPSDPEEPKPDLDDRKIPPDAPKDEPRRRPRKPRPPGPSPRDPTAPPAPRRPQRPWFPNIFGERSKNR